MYKTSEEILYALLSKPLCTVKTLAPFFRYGWGTYSVFKTDGCRFQIFLTPTCSLAVETSNVDDAPASVRLSREQWEKLDKLFKKYWRQNE